MKVYFRLAGYKEERELITIPKAAEPVVKILKHEVVKPEGVRASTISGVPRFPGNYCPMGLHPLSTHPTPAVAASFAGGACSAEAVNAFVKFWDHLTISQAKEAIKAIWG